MEFDPVLMEDLAIAAGAAEIDSLVGKTVLITGITGLIGSLVAKTLIYCNKKYGTDIRIIGVARDREKVQHMFPEMKADKMLSFFNSDIKELVEVEEDIDYIIHAASATASRYFVTNPVETIDITYSGTKRMLDLAVKKQIKGMVYVSSMEVYGVIRDAGQERISEDSLGEIDILNVRSCYPEGKRIAECMCHSYYEEYGVPVCMARLAQTFGAGVSLKDNRVFMQFAKNAVNGQDIVLHTAGESYGNYCYTRDVVKALLLLLIKGVSGEAYTVVNESTTMRIKDMAGLVADCFSGGKSKVVFDIPENQKILGYAADTKLRLSSKKLEALGWKPEVGMVEAYQRLMQSIKSQSIQKGADIC